MCLCKTDADVSYVYISKRNTVELVFDVDTTRMASGGVNNDFHVKYEFVNRNCSRFLNKNANSASKGKIIHLTSSAYGTQSSTTSGGGGVDTLAPKENNLEVVYNRSRKDDAEFISQLQIMNRNFHCEFHIRAPSNSFVHLEFYELRLSPTNCDTNNIKLYSSFTELSTESNSVSTPNVKPTYLFTICGNNSSLVSFSPDPEFYVPNSVGIKHVVDIAANAWYPCHPDKANPICLMTNKLKNRVNASSFDYSIMEGGASFYNDIVLNIDANDLTHFHFDIKYKFFKVEVVADDLSSGSNKGDTNIFPSQLTSFLSIYDKKEGDCVFKCNSSERNDQNVSFIYCLLDESLLCDGEIDCLIDFSDEVDCK